jgi:FAD/FMN-containing dehydrogenase
MDIAVSGGRHSTFFSSSTDGGLLSNISVEKFLSVVDLCKMRNVKVDVAGDCVIAQGGCLWEDVYTAAAQHDLTVGTLAFETTDCKWVEHLEK